MKIGILNCGGDCPGLNAVTHGVVGAASNRGWEVIGFRDGFEGLLPPGDFMVLSPAETAGIVRLGGTILGSTNKGHFVAKAGAGEVMEVPAEVIEKARNTLNLLGIKGLIVVGGDGSLTTALQLFRKGLPVIGVPKSIDNDLTATAVTFGFDSAVATVTDSLDRLQTTARSHKRIMVVEVMGRHAGWIALYGGIAGSASAILIPEIPFDYDRIAESVRKRDAYGYHSSVIVVAEGARPIGGELVGREGEGGGEMRLGGIGQIVAAELGARTGKDARTCVLGHLQRGGPPTSIDRVLGTRFGVMAVNLVEEEAFGQMVSYQQYRVGSVPIEEAVNRLHLVDPEDQVVQTAKAVGICFGD